MDNNKMTVDSMYLALTHSDVPVDNKNDLEVENTNNKSCGAFAERYSDKEQPRSPQLAWE